MVMTTSAPFTEADRAFGNRRTIGFGLIARSRDQIERDDLVSGLDQIGGHRPAHIAEADECDGCHDFLPELLFRLIEFQFVGADLGEVWRDHFRCHILDSVRRPAGIAILVDHGGAYALAEIVAAKHFQRRTILPHQALFQ